MTRVPALLFVAVAVFAAQAPAQQWAGPSPQQGEAQAAAVSLEKKSKLADDVRKAGYSENIDRCRRALQIVALCGSTGPEFSCGPRGFLAAPPGDSSGRAFVGDGRKQQMRRCAMQVTRGGF